MSRAPTLAVPDAIARKRQAEMQRAAGIASIRIQLSSEIYSRVVANEYGVAAMIAHSKAAKEVDPYNTRDDEDVEKEMPEKIPISVDVNTAARFSLVAADCLMFHQGMIGQAEAPGAEGEQQRDNTSGIVLGT